MIVQYFLVNLMLHESSLARVAVLVRLMLMTVPRKHASEAVLP
jgi:hypothetical protein